MDRFRVACRTIVIFLSDNGRPFPHSKTHLYDDSVKTPFIVHWPAGVPHPAVVDGLLSTIDIAPTLLDVAGLPRPATFQGVSFVPMLRDPGATIRDFVFAEKNWHNFSAHMRMVRFKDFVYIRNSWPELVQPGDSDTFYNPSADALKARHAQGRLDLAQANVFLQPRPPEEFYDLRADPAQVHNTVHDPFSRVAVEKLRGVLLRWTEETGDTPPKTTTETNIDYTTGARNHEFKRGTPPRGRGECAAHQPARPDPGPLRLPRRPQRGCGVPPQ
jgi:arylsulfatase A-like enzyme